MGIKRQDLLGIKLLLINIFYSLNKSDVAFVFGITMLCLFTLQYVYDEWCEVKRNARR